MADSTTGYSGVALVKRAKTKPYEAYMRSGGKKVNLGSFASAEEAALCVARAQAAAVPTA